MMTLAELIASEPANAGRTDAEVLAWLSESITVQGRVSHSDVMKWGATGPRLKLATAAADTQLPASLRAASLTALDLLQDGTTTFDTADAGNVGLLGALVDGAVLSTSDRSTLMTLGASEVTRWSTVMPGMDEPSMLYHIGRARNAA